MCGRCIEPTPCVREPVHLTIRNESRAFYSTRECVTSFQSTGVSSNRATYPHRRKTNSQEHVGTAPPLNRWAACPGRSSPGMIGGSPAHRPSSPFGFELKSAAPGLPPSLVASIRRSCAYARLGDRDATHKLTSLNDLGCTQRPGCTSTPPLTGVRNETKQA